MWKCQILEALFRPTFSETTAVRAEFPRMAPTQPRERVDLPGLYRYFYRLSGNASLIISSSPTKLQPQQFRFSLKVSLRWTVSTPS